MYRGIYAGASAMLVQEKALDVVANNLANADSAGFRGRINVNKSFPQLLVSRIESAQNIPDLSTPKVAPLGDAALNVVLSETAMMTRRGPIQVTDNPLDVAIDGEGFFVVQDAAGNAFYTRAGHFSKNAAGELVNGDGMPVLGDGGPIALGDAISCFIDDQGQVVADGEVIAQLQIVAFERPAYLRQVGRSLLAATPQAGLPQPAGAVRLVRGALERANVNVVEEMTAMVEANRAYEMAARSVTIQDEATGRLISTFSRVG